MHTSTIRLLASCVAAFMLPGAASAIPVGAGPLEAEVRAAIARYDLSGAGVAFEALVESRLPAKQTNRPDPLLDQLLVDAMVAQGAQPPRAIVERLISGTSGANRAHNLLLLATVSESGGDDDQARKQYAAVASMAGAASDQRLSAQLGLARLETGTDAAAAVARLRFIEPASVPIGRRWEVDLQLARALAIQAPTALAVQDAQLSKAWAEALDGGIADHAVAKVAGDRAMAAARAGNRAKLVALLAVDRTNRAVNGGQEAVASDLPVCGEKGVLGDDLAVVELQRIAPMERPAINLVWASRPAIGQLFVNAARRSGRLAISDGSVALFALRCRSAPAADYAVSVKLEDNIAGWMTSKGAYPFTDTDNNQNVTQLAAMLASRTTRYGASSIMRLPVLLQLLACTFPQVEADEQARARVNDLVR
jgi:hypothetical protein